MNSLYLISYAEIALKGKNRIIFIRKLVENIKNAFSGYGNIRVINTYGRLFLETDLDFQEVRKNLVRVFGISGFAEVKKISLDYENIASAIKEMAGKELAKNRDIQTFKISARRSNKNFPLDSYSLNCKLGETVLQTYPELKVSLYGPGLDIRLEIRDSGAYAYSSLIKGSGGLPVGMSGRGILLLSGGIDSPVAGWMMLKRGMSVLPLHFASPPYTSVRARQKVADLAKVLTAWGGENRMLIVNFTELQLKINTLRNKDISILLLRMAMVRLAEMAAGKMRFQALITGENLGQVASQTVESMTATASGCRIPVFRPLIGFDKMEIVEKAKQIETFEISIQPYEDCCTIFLPSNPKTKPRVSEIESEYESLKLQELVNEAFEKMEMIQI